MKTFSRFTACFHCGVTNDMTSKDRTDDRCFRCGTALTEDGKDPELKAALEVKDAAWAKQKATLEAEEAESEASAIETVKATLDDRAKELRSRVPKERKRRSSVSSDSPNS